MVQMTRRQTDPVKVQRQIVLPMSKAVEIAYKSIRLRLSRSLLVTSGIVLALAFLMSILAGDVILQGMRYWIAAAQGTALPDSVVAREFEAARQEARQLEVQLAATSRQLNAAAINAPALKKDQPKFDPVPTFKRDWAWINKNVGRLPADEPRLTRALSSDPALVPVMQAWIDQTRQLKELRKRIKSPDDVLANMALKGVPTTPEAIASSRIQTRWLLGLALLVAFVGILNAMLMSVTERFREIGTMKCLGALDSFIIKLFLIESLFQGLVGTLFGVITGLLLTLADAWSKYGGFAFKMIPMGSLMTMVAFCFLVGVALTVAGAVYPAWQAARMQPIEAMRVDA